jgi:lipopolysaccharide heptosyltransferase I
MATTRSSSAGEIDESASARHKILIIRPSALGDVCRSVPVLASLRAAFPDSQIDWLVQDAFAPAVASHPALSNIVEFPRAELKRWYAPSTTPAIKRFLNDLSARNYDLVLDCQGLLRSGIFALATRAERRIGFENAQELGWLGLTERVHAPKELHAVDRMLLLAEAAGALPVYDMRLYSNSEDRAWRERTLCGESDAVWRYGVIAPTTRWAGKRWSMSRFVELCKMLLADEMLGVKRLVIVGAGSEREQCAELLQLAATDDRLVDLVGRTTVGQLMATVEGSGFVVGCDSAAVHMAVGFGRPLAALYGPTRVDRVGPYRRNAHVVQRIIPGDILNHKDEAAGAKLMGRIQVSDVVECLAAQGSVAPASSPDRG